MKRFRGLLAVALTVVGLWTTNAQAQQKPGRYQPAYPTFSSYYDYFRNDTGLLNPYYSFVQPRRQFQSNLFDLQGTVQRQQTTVGNLQRDFDMRASGASPTGRGARFMNYSHFFPTAPSGRGGFSGRPLPR